MLCRVQGKFALEVASKALEYYEETVFKVPYPLKKSDLVAIPGEAMEPCSVLWLPPSLHGALSRMSA